MSKIVAQIIDQATRAFSTLWRPVGGEHKNESLAWPPTNFSKFCPKPYPHKAKENITRVRTNTLCTPCACRVLCNSLKKVWMGRLSVCSMQMDGFILILVKSGTKDQRDQRNQKDQRSQRNQRDLTGQRGQRDQRDQGDHRDRRDQKKIEDQTPKRHERPAR